MNKFGAFCLLASVTIAGSAGAAVFDECTVLNRPFVPSAADPTKTVKISCTTSNNASSGEVQGTFVSATNATPSTLVVNLTKKTNDDDLTDGFGKNNNNLTTCLQTDRNPSVASTKIATGCGASTTFHLRVQNRDNDV